MATLAPRRTNDATANIQGASMWLQKDEAKIVLGASADTNLFRKAAGELATDGDMCAVNMLASGGIGVGTVTTPASLVHLASSTGPALVTAEPVT